MPSGRRCPFFANGTPDPSVAKFYAALRSKLDDRALRVFAIDVSAVYRWKESDKPQDTVVVEKKSEASSVDAAIGASRP
jgi:hypothetical protein